MSSRAASAADFAGAELLVGDAEDAAAAREQLELMGEIGAAEDEAWAAWVEVDGDAVLVRGDAVTWSIWAPAGSDPSDSALAARRVHGRLGARAPGWDLDR